MKDIKPLNICNTEDAIMLYRQMIDEYKDIDPRLERVAVDEKSLRNLIQLSFDIENSLFFILYVRNEPIGFIDSSRLISANKNVSWYVKALYIVEKFRIFTNFELLIYKVEKEVIQKKINSIISSSIPFDTRTNAFWESLGYEIDGKKRFKVL